MAGREKIHRVQLIFMFLAAMFQGWGTGELIKTFGPDYTVEIFGTTGLAAQIILCSCLVNGVLIFYLIATNVSLYGLFNGFILFLFVRPLVSKTLGLIDGIQTDLRLPVDLHFSNFDEKMNFIYFFFVLVGVGFVLYQKRKKILELIYHYVLRNPLVGYQTKEKLYQVKTSPVPQTLTGGLGVLVLILQMVLYQHGAFSDNGTLRNVLWVGADMIDLGVTSFLLWLLFTNTYWVDHHLEGRASWLPERDKLKPYFIFWLVMSAFAVLINESPLFFHFSLTIEKLSRIFLEPIFILTTVILGIEIYEKWQFEQRSIQKVCLAEMDNVELVQLWVAQLEEANLSFHVEGLRYRQLTQFFAPYLKMRLFVDESQAQDAVSIIRLEEVKQI